MHNIIKNGILLNKREFSLSFIVFFYLIISFAVISRYVGSDLLPLVQLFFLFAENYITVSVYYGVRESLWEDALNIPEMFKKGRTFFFRVLAYKVLAGLFIVIVSAFCLSMLELVKETSLASAYLFIAFTVIWLSVPIYLFFLTAFTPLIIVAEDISFVKALKTSVLFLRERIAGIIQLLLLFLPIWFLVFFLLKGYNESNPILHIIVFYLVSILEVITVKTFLLFYKTER
ncbi:MAG: hypothetical protein GX554_04390 [Elusimicrobia bacterium]|nr:hypothetical protein [Elusimicrobiota bacterium]